MGKQFIIHIVVNYFPSFGQNYRGKGKKKNFAKAALKISPIFDQQKVSVGEMATCHLNVNI